MMFVAIFGTTISPYLFFWQASGESEEDVVNRKIEQIGKGIPIEKEIYDIDGFQIRFFTERKIRDLTAAEGFEILGIREEYQEPVTLYLVSSKKPWKIAFYILIQDPAYHALPIPFQPAVVSVRVFFLMYNRNTIRFSLLI